MMIHKWLRLRPAQQRHCRWHAGLAGPVAGPKSRRGACVLFRGDRAPIRDVRCNQDGMIGLKEWRYMLRDQLVTRHGGLTPSKKLWVVTSTHQSAEQCFLSASQDAPSLREGQRQEFFTDKTQPPFGAQGAWGRYSDIVSERKTLSSVITDHLLLRLVRRLR